MPAIRSVQSNAQPAGGTTAQQPVPANVAPNNMEALLEALTPAVARFRQQASPLVTPLNNSKALSFADSDQVRISSVGLGYKILCHFTGTVQLNNALAGAQVVSFGSKFPFNLIRQLQVQINGGAMVYSAGGLATLEVQGRKRRAMFVPETTASAGTLGRGLSTGLCFVQVGANGTTTNAPATATQLSGISSVSIAASLNTIITVDFYLVVKLAFDDNSLLGALPLQNNSTFATLTINTAATLIGASGNDTFPFFTVGAVPGTLTVGAMALTCKSIYRYWSVPQDPGLYSEMVSNSYQVQEQPNQTFSATGTSAILYNIPQNQYLAAVHLNGNDSVGVAIPFGFKTGGTQGYTALRIQYNAGAVIPVNEADLNAYRALMMAHYGHDIGFISGYMLWDGDGGTAEHVSDSDQAGWIDTYAAATPQLVADLAAGISTPGTFSITRESIVAGAVQVIGG